MFSFVSFISNCNVCQIVVLCGLHIASMFSSSEMMNFASKRPWDGVVVELVDLEAASSQIVASIGLATKPVSEAACRTVVFSASIAGVSGVFRPLAAGWYASSTSTTILELTYSHGIFILFDCCKRLSLSSRIVEQLQPLRQWHRRSQELRQSPSHNKCWHPSGRRAQLTCYRVFVDACCNG